MGRRHRDFFELKLTNLTGDQVDVDLADSAVISVDGEARPLARMVATGSPLIPPKSYVVLSSSKGAIFGTDILGRFNNGERREVPDLPRRVPE